MVENFVFDLILALQALAPLGVGLILLIFCFGCLFLLYRFFGYLGLCAYMLLAILVANIQVLKWVKFTFLPHPIAMGTAVFSSLFLVTDWITERYGPDMARRAIYLSFLGQAMFTGLMLLTLGFQPCIEGMAMHEHLMALFTPSLGIFCAGLIAFTCGQLYDAYLYQALKIKTQGRHLWLRASLSYALAALLDNCIFSILAWRVFALEPLSWSVLWQSYILGTYGFRLVFAVFNVSALYLLRNLRDELAD